VIRIAIALCCVACGATAKRPTTNVADAVVAKHFVIGARGADPTILRWSGKGAITIVGDLTGDGLADALAIDGGAQLLVGRPPHTLGSAVPVAGREEVVEMLGAVTIADLDGDGANEVVVNSRVEYPPPGSVVGATPYVKTSLDVLRGGARGLGKPVQQIHGSAIGHDLLASTDVDGDGRADLVTYQCEKTCTVSAWRATSQLGPATVIATWKPTQRTVIGAARPSGYVIVAVEAQAIRTYALERGALRELAQVTKVAHRDRDALFGPAAVGDFDRDGRLDIVVVTGGNKLLAWSDGKPTPPLALASPERVRTVALVDLDRDGDDDLLVSTDDLVSMYRGSPAGLEASPSWKASLR